MFAGRADRGDDDEQPVIEIPTKDLSTVQDFGELVYELMVSQLDIEEPFKLYYVDNEGDSMLVSAHTSLRDVIYSEAVTAKVRSAAAAVRAVTAAAACAGGSGGVAASVLWAAASVAAIAVAGGACGGG